MIIFCLDTLADDSHRRHFIEPYEKKWVHEADYYGKEFSGQFGNHLLKKDGTLFDKPDLQAYNDACDKDEPIFPAWFCFHRLAQWADIAIWSNRCESLKEKTIKYLMNKCPLKPTYWDENSWSKILKMRPIGDNTPEHKLKERWLNERKIYQYCNLCYGSVDYGCPCKNNIDFVFDSDPDSIAMWKRRGIFVFDCNQKGVGMYRHGVEVLAIKEGDYSDHIADLKDEGE